MKLQGAVVKEQGVTFAIVIVKKRVLDSKGTASRMIGAVQQIFPGVPIVLMAQDFRGRPTYYGRKDIVRFLAKVPMSAIPWREYTLT